MRLLDVHSHHYLSLAFSATLWGENVPFLQCFASDQPSLDGRIVMFSANNPADVPKNNCERGKH